MVSPSSALGAGVLGAAGTGSADPGGGGAGVGLVASLLPILSLIAAAGFFLLFLLARRRSRRDPARPVEPVADGGAMALAAVPLGPRPVLEPAAIFRQVLWDPAEVAPVWVRAPAEPESAPPEPPDEAAPTAGPAAEAVTALDDAQTTALKPTKRTRRPKPEGSTPRRTRKTGGAQPPA